MWLLLWAVFIPIISYSEQQGVILPLPTNVDRTNYNSYASQILAVQGMRYTTDCKRTCIAGRRRACFIHLEAEHYQAMGVACGNCSNGVLADCFAPQCVSADGVEKGILTLNRQLPGPPIEVCQGDLIIITVMNLLHSDTFSIHWHGLLQRGTNYMDGVPHVTQCPITPMASFRYTFWADDVGTYFYHSHSGMQKYIGIFGAFIIRAPAPVENFPLNLFDVDNRIIIFNDWSHDAAEMFQVGLPTRFPGSSPEALLINGKGKYYNNVTNTLTNSPYATVYVQAGRTYRFRIINAISMSCPVEMQIQNHRMQIIATDGSPVVPRWIDTLVMASGERYDVVVRANRSATLYWIHARLAGICENRMISQSAVLSYINNSEMNGDSPSTPMGPYPRGVVFNDPTVPCGSSANNLCLTDLVNPNGPGLATAVVDQRFYLTFSNRFIDADAYFASDSTTPFWNIRNREMYLGTMNGISLAMTASPLLTMASLDNLDICNYDNLPARCANSTICSCLHVIVARQNSVVEFVLIDESPEPEPVVHPIHFHGLKFMVTSEGQVFNNGSLTIAQMRRLNREGALRGNNTRPPLKDTVLVRTQGYVVMRFLANNPGIWLVHCHIDDHMVFGMGFVLIIEGPVPPIPQNFPTCGNFP
ncbi:uncharacterized protein LOC143920267 [Arctopsyche grandis]|uniref:uncharacterized protein LOC143920267 n=1 Tax=Arctopsyche grandis TaxID=121162 RepID=UPI00406D786E